MGKDGRERMVSIYMETEQVVAVACSRVSDMGIPKSSLEDH